jgi:hypothetical protein
MEYHERPNQKSTPITTSTSKSLQNLAEKSDMEFMNACLSEREVSDLIGIPDIDTTT